MGLNFEENEVVRGQQLFSYWIIVLIFLKKGKVTILFTSKVVKMLVKDDQCDFLSVHNTVYQYAYVRTI